VVRRAIRLGSLFLAPAALLGACAGEPRSETALDLLALFPYTASGLAAARIDLASPDARAHLRGGWSAPVDLPGRGVGRFAVAGSASLQVAIRTPQDARLLVRCGLLGEGPRRPVAVRVRLNGNRLGVLRVAGGLSEHTLALPASAQRVGLNVLGFTRSTVGRSRRSAPAGGSGQREPARRSNPSGRVSDEARDGSADGSLAAFAVATVAFVGIDTATGARVAETHDGSGRLVLAPSAAVDFFLRLPRAGRLTFGAEPVHGGVPGGGRLRVAMQAEGDRERVLFDGLPPGDVAIALGDRERRLGRVTFAAVGPSEVRVTAPTVFGVVQAHAARAVYGGPGTSGEGRELVRPEGIVVGSQPRRDLSWPAVAADHTERRNVLLYVVDTLRADRLGCYGYPRPTSPAIDALAAEGVVFDRAIAQSSWTTPATATLLTGRIPSAHGAVDVGAAIRPEVATLAEVLHARGYRTAAFVTNVNVRGGLGFARGFDQYVYLAEDRARPTVHVPADTLGARAIDWLDQRAGPGPFFLYVHASDPHAPYAARGTVPGRDGAAPTDRVSWSPPPARPPGLPADADPLRLLRRAPATRTPAHVAYLRALYDREVAVVDAAIGQLMDALRARGLYDDTLVVVTADHGEEFHEHGGFEHGRTLYRELLAVPLIIRFPGARLAGRRIARLVGQIDVLPTLVARLGMPVPAGVQGRALTPVLGGDGLAGAGDPTAVVADAQDQDEAYTDADEAYYSETRLGGCEVAALSMVDWKAIHRLCRDGPTFELYDLGRDPGETTNVARTRPIALGHAEQALARWAASGGAGMDIPAAGGAAGLDPETAATLRVLGYLDEGR